MNSAAPAADGVQQVEYVEPAPEPHYSSQPMQANATVIVEGNMHECWGGGWDEVRFVSSNTPVQVLGTGPWTPPPGQENELGPGPYVKIRIWDGQYGWIAESAVNVKADYVDKIAGVCEEGDRIDWSNVVRPTPRPTLRPQPAPRAVPTYRPATTTTNTANPYQPAPTPRPEAHKFRDE